jgi:ABC-type multidrug transport system ATPase subunit
VLLLNKGEIVALGKPDEVIDIYRKEIKSKQRPKTDAEIVQNKQKRKRDLVKRK